MARVTFLGAAGMVTGSATLLAWGSTRLLFDCDLFQGPEEIEQANIFYGKCNDNPMNHATVLRAVRAAARAAGTRERVTPPTLRHSCATHLLESGTILRYLHELLGHRSLRTTQIYTQVSPRRVTGLLSPLDRLGFEAPAFTD